MQPMVLPRESISSIYAVVIPVRPLFATSSSAQSTDIHSDTVFGTPLRRACGASCIRLELFSRKSLGHSPEGEVKKSDNFFWGVKRAVLGLYRISFFLEITCSVSRKLKLSRSRHAGADTRRSLCLLYTSDAADE